MLARAEAMSPVLRERRTATESAGHLLDENNDAFIKAGFYRASLAATNFICATSSAS
jgi:hypothetical protein